MRFTLVALTALTVATTHLSAQRVDHPPRRILSIGNYPCVVGLRLNFRDDDLERVDGMNVTIWAPYEPSTGTVRGFALGLPITGAEDIHGLSLGAFGVAGGRDLEGITIAGLGAGAGRRMRGLTVGGIGVGSGGGIEGIAIGGIGAGTGGNARGALIGGVGSGVGGNLEGLAIGGIGVGAGGNVRGVAVGGIGAGAGGDVHGIAIGGIGVGAGGTITGIAIGGAGVGSGSGIRGFAASVLGVGAPSLRGGFAAAAVGALHAEGIVVAPLLFRIERGGSFRGGSVSAVNYIRGSQTGLTIGIVNYARSVNGTQIGVINIIADQRSHPVMPLVNWGQ